MTEPINAEFPELEQSDWEAVMEYAGKLIDSGTDTEKATLEAISAILLDRKKSNEADKKGVRFVKIGGAEIKPTHWIIKGLIDAGKDFYGMPVRRKGAAYYIAAEGRGGIIRRFRAWSQENNIPINDAPLYLYNGAVNLLEAADILIKALDEAIKAETEPPSLVVIDTWARSLGDDDSDTSAAAEGLAKIDQIRALFPDMAVLIIHHTGHANKDRARGASLLHAAVDSEYRLEVDRERNIIMSNTKSKESELLPPMAFRARSVKLLDDGGGYILNEDGEIETSAVLDLVEGYTPPVEGLGTEQKWILDTLKKAEGGSLDYEDLYKAFKQDKPGKRKYQLDRSLESLEERGVICRDGGLVCLT